MLGRKKAREAKLGGVGNLPPQPAISGGLLLPDERRFRHAPLTLGDDGESRSRWQASTFWLPPDTKGEP
jgi:hypothetical protein